MSYELYGPEGYPDRPDGHATLNDLVRATARFMLRFMRQGYYADSSMVRQTLEWVADNLSAASAPGNPPPGDGWYLLGAAHVDSDKLMICDPHYVDAFWLRPDASTPHGRVATYYAHEATGAYYFCAKRGSAPTPDAIGFDDFDAIIPELGKSVNDLVLAGDLVEAYNTENAEGEFSYHGCCATVDSEEQGGSLLSPQGNEGVGVVFRAGLGDGVYPVFARRLPLPMMGERVTEVRILLVDDDTIAALAAEEEDDA